MSFEAVRSISLTPGSVISARRFVTLAADGKIDHTGNTLDAQGVSLEAAAADAGPAIPVALLDGSKLEVESGAAVAVGARVMSDATGRAITAVGATARVLGVALTISGGAGQVITILSGPAAGEFVA